MAQERAVGVDSVYIERRVFNPPKEFVEKAHIRNMEEYRALHRRSLEDPHGFWAEMAEKHLDWFKKWEGPAEEYGFKDDIFLRYFVGTNLSLFPSLTKDH